MNRSLKPLLFLFFACALLSCSNDKDVIDEQEQDVNRPVADYEIIPGDDPFTFEFKNKSSNYKELEWRFGDDSLSAEESPSHIFLNDGTYEVNLKATAEDGSTAKKLLVIKIDPDKVASIVAKPTGVTGTVKFSTTSAANITSAIWDFGDGTNSTDLAPTKAYAEGQLFTAKIALKTDKGSVATITKLVSSNGSLTEVINSYLLNVGPAFRAAQRVGTRWGIVADWRVNTAVKQREGNMGGWDEWEGNSMSMESWGGEPDITNGKIEQTTLIPLPVGQYYYEMQFHDFQVKDQLYNVVSKADELPDVDKVTTDPDVLGYTTFMGNAPLTVTTAFKLAESRKVTIGFVSTFIQNDQNFKLTKVRLYKQDE